MEPILVGDVLLTKSCNISQNGCNTRNTQISGGRYGCEVEQYCGQYHGTDWVGSCGFWRVAGYWLRFAGCLRWSCFNDQLRPGCSLTGGAKRQLSDSGYFRVLG